MCLLLGVLEGWRLLNLKPCSQGNQRCTCGGLVQEEDGWGGDEGAGNVQAALLATRQATHQNAAWQGTSHLHRARPSLMTVCDTDSRRSRTFASVMQLCGSQAGGSCYRDPPSNVC